MAIIACCGEGMLELVRPGTERHGDWRLGYGGDTLNTGIHLARAGHDVGYLTALGEDIFSRQLRDQWGKEGLDCSLALTHPVRHAGLYAVTTDDKGERSFTYWRDSSAAREMFALPTMAAAAARCARCDLFLFSLITLAILPGEGRASLLDLARTVRARGGHVAFDGNYRARLWAGGAEAAKWRDEAIAVADIGLPTLDDERALGLGDAAAVAGHWRALGCNETIVKLGAAGCLLPDGSFLAPPATLRPVDTSGAGDAFNGGYLAARLTGADIRSAALAGHERAGWCIMRRGAIPPLDA